MNNWKFLTLSFLLGLGIIVGCSKEDETVSCEDLSTAAISTITALSDDATVENCDSLKSIVSALEANNCTSELPDEVLSLLDQISSADCSTISTDLCLLNIANALDAVTTALTNRTESNCNKAQTELQKVKDSTDCFNTLSTEQKGIVNTLLGLDCSLL